MVKRHSRPEGFSKIRSTLEDKHGTQASIVDDATYNDPTGTLKFKGIEAGAGILINIVDADDSRFLTTDKKIVIGIDESDSSVNDRELLTYKALNITPGQTLFPLPSNTIDVHTVTINGLETTNYLFTLGPPTVAINWVAEGYTVDETDEVLIMIYQTP